jgi:hypothetical protein
MYAVLAKADQRRAAVEKLRLRWQVGRNDHNSKKSQRFIADSMSSMVGPNGVEPIDVFLGKCHREAVTLHWRNLPITLIDTRTDIYCRAQNRLT